MENHKKKERGFTVIELIIVIAIIAILSSVIGIYASNYSQKAKTAATQTEVNELAKAVLLYKTQHGCYPDPTSCNGTSCDCLPEGEQSVVINNSGKKTYFELGINNLINFDLPFVSADQGGGCNVGEYLYCEQDEYTCMCDENLSNNEDGCTQEWDDCCPWQSWCSSGGSSSGEFYHAECGNELCNCVAGCGQDQCNYDEECEEGSSSSSSGGGSSGTVIDFVNVLVDEKLLSGGDDIYKDAWGHNYRIALNFELASGGGTTCSFVHSFGPNEMPNTNTAGATNCEEFFISDDIYALIESNEADE